MNLKYPDGFYISIGLTYGTLSFLFCMGLNILYDGITRKDIPSILCAILGIAVLIFIAMLIWKKTYAPMKQRLDILMKHFVKSIVEQMYVIDEQLRILKKQDPINYKGYIEKLLELEEMENEVGP